MSSIWKKGKIKKADVIMVMLIVVGLIFSLTIAFLFGDQKTDVILNGTSVTFQEEGKEGAICSLEIRCDRILENLEQVPSQKRNYIPENGIILEKTNIHFSQGETVFQVLQRVCKDADIQLEYSWTPLYDSYYIEGIQHIYEFDCGSQSGWMYQVNDVFPNYGCSSYVVESGDEIVWSYTCQGLGIDLGAKGL